MNEYDLFDAIGGIDDELLRRSEHRAVRKFPIRKALIAAAAVMALAVTAIAAPAIMELLFNGEMEQTTYGATLAALDGTMIEYDDIYQIHFNVDDIEGLPTSIEEYQIPHYVVENGWTLDGGYLYSYEFGENTNIRWENVGVPDAWIEFEQSTINQFADWVDQAPGTNEFYIVAPQGTAVTPTTVSTSLGDIEGYVSLVLPSSDTPHGGSRLFHVFWRSGDYAFHTITSATIDPELLAQLIQSIGPVEDPAPYLVDNDRTGISQLEPNPTLRNPLTLSALPNGYELRECNTADDSANWYWFQDNDNYIQFFQYTGSYIDSCIHQYTLNQTPHTLESLNLDDVTVYFITAEDHIAALWTDDGCEYALMWASEDARTWEQMEALIRSLEPVDDISAYVTE